MTQEQIRESSNNKVKAIETLMRQLQIVVMAKQMVTRDGFIENIVYYNDIESYPKEEEKKLPTDVDFKNWNGTGKEEKKEDAV